MSERKKVDLGSYVFEVIEYDPTENPRGVVTHDEWNTILSLLKSSSNYTSRTLQEVFTDLYTAHELSSTAPGESGASLIGVEPIAGLSSTIDLKGNVNKALKELVDQIRDITLGSIPPSSIGSDRLTPNLNFTGDSLTFNNVDVLTEDYISQEINSNSSTTELTSAKTIYDNLLLKQNNIEIGEEAPDDNVTSNIYIQLENDDLASYTKEEADVLLETKQNKLKAGSNIKIDESTNTISAVIPTGLSASSFVVTTHTWGQNAHGDNWQTKDYTQTKTGYKCIGVVGFRRDANNGEHYSGAEHGIQLIDSTTGKATVRITTKGTSEMAYQHGASGYYQLLWVKV